MKTTVLLVLTSLVTAVAHAGYQFPPAPGENGPINVPIPVPPPVKLVVDKRPILPIIIDVQAVAEAYAQFVLEQSQDEERDYGTVYTQVQQTELQNTAIELEKSYNECINAEAERFYCWSKTYGQGYVSEQAIPTTEEEKSLPVQKPKKQKSKVQPMSQFPRAQ